MKTKELKGALLDYWVARANEVSIHDLQIGVTPTTGDRIVCIETDRNGSVWMVYDPSTNWSKCGLLIEKYNLGLEPMDKDEWWAQAGYGQVGIATTPLEALCRCVVYAKFGEEVPGEKIRGM